MDAMHLSVSTLAKQSSAVDISSSYASYIHLQGEPHCKWCRCMRRRGSQVFQRPRTQGDTVLMLWIASMLRPVSLLQVVASEVCIASSGEMKGSEVIKCVLLSSRYSCEKRRRSSALFRDLSTRLAGTPEPQINLSQTSSCIPIKRKMHLALPFSIGTPNERHVNRT